MKGGKKIYLVLAISVLAVPLGLLSENPAWGEWEESFYEKVLGFVPEGIALGETWHAPIPDYAVPGMGDVAGYYLSAVIGVIAIFLLFGLVRRFLLSDGEKR